MRAHFADRWKVLGLVGPVGPEGGPEGSGFESGKGRGGKALQLNRIFVDHEPISFNMERYGRLRDMDRSFDIAYWQRLGPQAIFEAAWQIVVVAHSRRPGGSDELKFRRSIETFQPQPR
jgi:hypothetical protein